MGVQQFHSIINLICSVYQDSENLSKETKLIIIGAGLSTIEIISFLVFLSDRNGNGKIMTRKEVLRKLSGKTEYVQDSVTNKYVKISC